LISRPRDESADSRRQRRAILDRSASQSDRNALATVSLAAGLVAVVAPLIVRSRANEELNVNRALLMYKLGFALTIGGFLLIVILVAVAFQRRRQTNSGGARIVLALILAFGMLFIEAPMFVQLIMQWNSSD
jgi:hypothetical protein